MAESLDLGFARSSRQITHGNIHDSQPQYGRGKQQLKIAEGIEVSEILAPRNHALVVGACQQFCSAKGIADAQVENATQHFREENISQAIQETHGFDFHGVHQARSVDEVALDLAVGAIEPAQHFGGMVRLASE